MNKICFCILVVILYVNKYSSCEHVNIPKADKELAKGFLDGSGLKSFLNLKICEREFYDFLEDIFDVMDSLTKNDNKAVIFKDLGTTFILYSDLTKKCVGTKEKFEDIMNYVREAFNNPQKYLIGVMDNAVSLHVVKLYWGLSGKIKDGKFYEVGNVIGEILNYVLNVNFEISELKFLGEISDEKKIKKFQTNCKELIYELINEIFIITKNILNEKGAVISMVEFNVNRIYEYITRFKTSCIHS